MLILILVLNSLTIAPFPPSSWCFHRCAFTSALSIALFFCLQLLSLLSVHLFAFFFNLVGTSSIPPSLIHSVFVTFSQFLSILLELNFPSFLPLFLTNFHMCALSSTFLFSHFFSYYYSVHWSTFPMYEHVVMISSDYKAFHSVMFQTNTWFCNFIFFVTVSKYMGAVNRCPPVRSHIQH